MYVMENRSSSNKILSDDICLLFYLLIVIYVRISAHLHPPESRHVVPHGPGPPGVQEILTEQNNHFISCCLKLKLKKNISDHLDVFSFGDR
jgi:hypothetical protein